MLLKDTIKEALRDPLIFTGHLSHLELRRYQTAVILAVVDSILHRRGLSFVVMFPRQSGKNELQAQLETYLLTLLQLTDAEIVKVSPTWKPQSLNAMRRLDRVLTKNVLTRASWARESGYIFRIGRARVIFLSGAPEANIVGATASTLLEVDEAQDVQVQKFDKDIAPMAASTDATRIFWGTAWTSNTLLARELRAARQAEAADGVRRAFVISADDVGREVPSYARFVQNQIARLGRNHPLIKSQFYCEEIDSAGGLFPPARRAMLQGSHVTQDTPVPNHIYALLIDVAGADETASAENSAMDAGGGAGEGADRDSTSLSVIEIDLSSLTDFLVARPVYRLVKFHEWIGVKHTSLFNQIVALVNHWQARYLVIDATGIGAGLTSFLSTAFPGQVLPFTFTSHSKSKLGWDFISLIETGRFKLYATQDGLRARYLRQLEFIQSSVAVGPGRVLSWSVPDGTRDPDTGELLHDDLVKSSALTTVLDDQPWGAADSEVVPSADPLAEFGEVY